MIVLTVHPGAGNRMPFVATFLSLGNRPLRRMQSLSVCSCLAASLCRERAWEKHETTPPAVSRRLSSTCPRNATVYTAHPSSVIPREMKDRFFYIYFFLKQEAD